MSAATVQSTQLLQLGGIFATASLVVTAWDGFIRLDKEVDFIWKMPHTAYIRWLYLFGAYVGLIVQTVLSTIQICLAYHPQSSQFCRLYHAFQMTAVMLLMICFDTLLILRIYALCGRYTWSWLLATCAVVGECVAAIVSISMTIPWAEYDSACALDPAPKSTLPYVIGMFTSQSILVWLAYRQRQRVGRNRTSIACVTIRDGVLAFACLAVFAVFAFVYDIHGSSITSFMIYWLPMIFSVATCRIILNLQCVLHEDPSQQFSTGILGLEGNADS